MDMKLHHRERGQSVAIVALLSVAMIGMLALALDGGNAYLKRRTAQNGADGGAMAGAREVCLGKTDAEVIATAQNYALRNGVPEPLDQNAVVLVGGGLVTVTASIPFPTWFGGVIGQPEMTAHAIAAAGCFAPGGGEGVLPIAYSCKDGVLEDQDGQRYCDVLEYGEANPYIIMDSLKTEDDFTCDDPATPDVEGIDCDWDGDGINEIIQGGDRSWLDLNGLGGGASQMCTWIENGYSPEIRTHTWIPGNDGDMNSVFACVENILFKQVLLPVYDIIDQAGPPDPLPHEEDVVVPTNAGSAVYYHVISFSIFVPTCVHWQGGPNSDCELYTWYSDDGNFGGDAPYGNEDKTVEGYFVEGFASGIIGDETCEDCTEAGAWTIFLTQ